MLLACCASFRDSITLVYITLHLHSMAIWNKLSGYKNRYFRTCHSLLWEPFLRDLIYSDQRCLSDMGSKDLGSGPWCLVLSLGLVSGFSLPVSKNCICLPLSSVSDSCESDLTIQTTLLTHWVLDNLVPLVRCAFMRFESEIQINWERGRALILCIYHCN